MISPWWLILIPIASGISLLFGGLFAEKGRQDDCANGEINEEIVGELGDMLDKFVV